MPKSLQRVIEMKCSIEFKRLFRKNKLGKDGKESKASNTALNLIEGKKKKTGKSNTASEASVPAIVSPDKTKKKNSEEKDTQKKYNIKKRRKSTSTPSMDSAKVGRKRKKVMKNKSIESNYFSKLCKKKKNATQPACKCAVASMKNENDL